MADKNKTIRTICIFLVSFIVSLGIIYLGNKIKNNMIYQRMVKYSILSSRVNDKAVNRVIMNGNSGYLGNTNVYLKYLEDGYIQLSGNNTEEFNGWKLLSRFSLEPGTYSLTGLTGANKDTIALQLYISDETGFRKYLYQFDEDVTFIIKRETEAILHVRVYPSVELVDVMARPAVYRNE